MSNTTFHGRMLLRGLFYMLLTLLQSDVRLKSRLFQVGDRPDVHAVAVVCCCGALT